MHITIIAIGKLKETYWKEAEAEYLKRLSPYAKLTIIELNEEAFSDKDARLPAGRQVIRIKELEAKKILKQLNDSDSVIALHETGKEFTSIGFADFLQKQTSQGQHITFVIGGSLGLHESVLKRVNTQISLSHFTFPHQMVRTILLEQIYRAVTIMKGKQYHY